MKSSLHSLIPFLPFLLNFSANCQLRKLDSILILAAWDPRYVALEWPPTENTASSIVACWFTAAEMCLPLNCTAMRAAQSHRERRLQYLLYCCVTSEHTWCVPLLRVYGPLPSNGCFSASTVLAFSECATV
jgi:hypothetical protein